MAKTLTDYIELMNKLQERTSGAIGSLLGTLEANNAAAKDDMDFIQKNLGDADPLTVVTLKLNEARKSEAAQAVLSTIHHYTERNVPIPAELKAAARDVWAYQNENVRNLANVSKVIANAMERDIPMTEAVTEKLYNTLIPGNSEAARKVEGVADICRKLENALDHKRAPATVSATLGQSVAPSHAAARASGKNAPSGGRR